MTAGASRVSLLRKLYAGEVPLAKVFWGYWLGLGLLTFLIWCLIVAIPYMLFYEASLMILEELVREVPSELDGWREWSRWIALALLPVFAAPGYALFHSLIFFLPVERSAKQAPPGSFWATRTGIVFCLLPLLLFMLPGLPFLILGFMLSFSGGLVSIGIKIVTFSLGLVPHGLLLLALGLIRVKDAREGGGSHE